MNNHQRAHEIVDGVIVGVADAVLFLGKASAAILLAVIAAVAFCAAVLWLNDILRKFLPGKVVDGLGTVLYVSFWLTVGAGLSRLMYFIKAALH